MSNQRSKDVSLSKPLFNINNKDRAISKKFVLVLSFLTLNKYLKAGILLYFLCHPRQVFGRAITFLNINAPAVAFQ